MPKTEAFDQHYEQYEYWFVRNRFAYESELRAVERLIPSDGRGVEIGTGSGRFAVPLGITIGVEPSPAMRKLARRRYVARQIVYVPRGQHRSIGVRRAKSLARLAEQLAAGRCDDELSKSDDLYGYSQAVGPPSKGLSRL